jgi:soluble lytic murein transglycosylase-like protein
MEVLQPSRRRQRIGFFIHGSKLWFSELIAMTLVMLLLISLMSIIAVVFINYFTIQTHDKKIASLRKEQIELDDSIGSLGQVAKITAILRTLAGARVPDHTLCEVAWTVSRNSSQFGYDPLLLLAVIRVESVFNPLASGRFASGAPSGAFGLMQLKFETASQIAGLLGMRKLTKKDLLNPEINLVLGVAYLTQQIALFKSFKLGILAYNQGPGTIYQTLSAHEPLSLNYYRNVLKNYYHLKKLAITIGH